MNKATPSPKKSSNRVGSRELVRADELLAHEWPLGLALCPNEEDGAFDGSCPCAVIHGQGFEVETRCWRVAGGHSEIHVSGTLPQTDLQRIAEHIRDNNGWTHSTDWQIHLCPNTPVTDAKPSTPANTRAESPRSVWRLARAGISQ